MRYISLYMGGIAFAVAIFIWSIGSGDFESVIINLLVAIFLMQQAQYWNVEE